MKQRLFIFGSLLLLVIAMIGLNAASYVQKVKEPDDEIFPNRSSYNPGATGTMAFYSILAETGRNVRRWQLPIESLEADDKNKPATFIVIGPLKRPFTDVERQSLLNWTAMGGRLIIIDREPETELVSTTAEWRVEFSPVAEMSFLSVDPADQTQMTLDTPAAKASQLTSLTSGVNAIQASRLSSSIRFERFEANKYEVTDDTYQTEPPPKTISGSEFNLTGQWAVATPTPNADMPQPPPPAKRLETEQNDKPYVIQGDSADEEEYYEGEVFDVETLKEPRFLAPISQFASKDRNIVVEVPYGGGQIIYVADPFIVSNGGINMADNVQFALNLAGSGNIAFDEFHHGFGSGNNRILEYFSGTPLVAILLQIIAIVLVVMYSRSRRFARALHEPEPNRLSKLEYVEAMADIQRSTKAYDLAIENIYADFRRRVAKLFGVDNFSTTRKELANRISERAGMEISEVEDLMAKSEDIIHGENTDRAEVLRLTAKLREIESKLNLSRKPRTRI